MFIKKEKLPFMQDLVSRQRQLLQENLTHCSVPVDEQKKIIAKRGALPDNYHEMPSDKPSMCFWLFENSPYPTKTKPSQLTIDSFTRCKDKLRRFALEEESSTNPSP